MKYTDKELEYFAVPVPRKTRTYAPVSHESIVKHTHRVLESKNLVITDKQYQVAAKGEILTGTYVIESPDRDFKRMISFINSYNKTRRLGFVSGLQTFVCENGCINGDFDYSKKHMGTVNLEIIDAVIEQVDILDTQYDTLKKWLERAQMQILSPREMAELAGRMFIEKEILKPNQLSILKQEIKKPSFDYGENNDTAYSLYQHVTHSLKKSHPLESSKQFVKAYEFFDNYVLK